MALAVSSAPVPAKAEDCTSAVLDLLETYRALAEGDQTQGDLISSLEDAVIMRPACAPVLIGAAVGSIDGDDAMIERIVRSGIEIVPEQAEGIVAAAREASNLSDQAVEAAANTAASAAPPSQLIPTSGADLVTTDERTPEIAWVSFPASTLRETGSPGVILEPTPQPIPVILALGAGFDDNVSTSPQAVDSGYFRATLGAKIQKTLTNSRLEISADSTYLDYGKNAPGLREGNHLAGLGLRYQLGIGQRWTLFEEFQMRRDTNPDIHGTQSTALRQPAYHTLFNRIAAAFDVSPLWQLRGGYTFSAIDYVGNTLAAIEERSAQAVGIETLHRVIGSVQVGGSYEAEFVDFRSSNLDYTRHQTLAALHTSLGAQIQAYIAAGAQFREGGSGGSRTTPAAEASLTWMAEPQTTQLRWLNRYGQFDHELALLGFDQREGAQSLIEASHALTDLISLHASAGLLATGFQGASRSLDETAWTASLEATWHFISNFDLNAGYHLVRLDSPIATRDYTRHQVDVGLIRMF